MSSESKLVSKDLLIAFGSKCKKIFRGTLSTDASLLFVINLRDSISALDVSLIKIIIKGTINNEDLHSEVVISFDTENYLIQAVQYGSINILSLGIGVDVNNKFFFTVNTPANPEYIEFEVVNILKENINDIEDITLSLNEDLEDRIVESITEFKTPYSENDTKFSIIDSDGVTREYSYNKIFSSIQASDTAKRLNASRTFSVSGFVTGSTLSDLSSNSVDIETTMSPVDQDNYTTYYAVNIDNKTGAIEGNSEYTPKTWVTTGYPSTSTLVRPIYADSNGRGYIVLPASESGSDSHHMDLTSVDASAYPNEIIQHIGETGSDFIRGYFYESYSNYVRHANVSTTEAYQDVLFSTLDSFTPDGLLEKLSNYNSQHWTKPSSALFNPEFPLTLYVIALIVPNGETDFKFDSLFYCTETDTTSSTCKYIRTINGLESLSEFGLSVDEDALLAYHGESTQGKYVPFGIIDITETTYSWRQIDVQPITIESIDDKTINDLN